MLNLKNICLYLIFVLSLFVGFIFQENASGGAKIDHDFFQTYINYFYLDFETGLKKISRKSIDHNSTSSILYID